MNEQTSILSAHGRMSRGRYWIIWLICFFTNVALAFLIASINKESIKALLFVSFFLSIFLLIQGIKRMHDTGRSGWYIIVPFYNLILAFTQGVDGENEYGPDPLNPENTGLANEFSTLDTISHLQTTITNDEKSANDRQALIYFILTISFSYLSWLVHFIFFRMNSGSENYSNYSAYADILGYATDFSAIALSSYFMATVRNDLARKAFCGFIIFRIVMEMIQTIPISA